MVRFWTSPTTLTKEGGVAFTLSDKQELIRMCLTSFLSADFYNKESDKVDDIVKLAKWVDPDFALKLAIFSRDYGLRSVNHVLFTEVAKAMSGKTGSRDKLTNALAQMVKRPDELMDILGYFAFSTGQNMNSIKFPNGLKTAIKSRLESFKDYQLAKYKGKGEGVNLYDLVNMTHAYSVPIDKMMRGILESADTWESELSANGNTKEGWLRLLKEDKIGTVALIRNMRNMLQSGTGTGVISDAILKADFTKVFPFQAMQALDAVNSFGVQDQALNDIILTKVKESFKFIAEKYTGKIVIGIDVSGSMFGTTLSKMSSMDRAQVAIQYGMILKELCNADLYLWSSPDHTWNSSTGGFAFVDTDDYQVVLKAAVMMKNGTDPRPYLNYIEDKGYDWNIMISDGEIRGWIQNVAKKGTVIWEIADSRDTCASGNWAVSFSGYDDTMWKIGSDIFRLWELEKQINAIDLWSQSSKTQKK